MTFYKYGCFLKVEYNELVKHLEIARHDEREDEYIHRMKSYAGAEKLTRTMALELIEYIKVDKKPKTVTRVLQIRGLQLNLDERTVSINRERISLTYKEFEFLKMFMKNPGIVFSRDTLYNEIWGADFVGETRTVDAHIRTLRQKLEEYGETIKTVRNVGYRMKVENDK